MDTVVSSKSISQLLRHSNSKWVTRERPKIDRIACPWLIRRFIEARAEFLYVPAGEVRAVAAAEQGVVVYDALYASIRTTRAGIRDAGQLKHKP